MHEHCLNGVVSIGAAPEDGMSLEKAGHTASVDIQAQLSVVLPPLAQDKEYKMPDEIDVTVNFGTLIYTDMLRQG